MKYLSYFLKTEFYGVSSASALFLQRLGFVRQYISSCVQRFVSAASSRAQQKVGIRMRWLCCWGHNPAIEEQSCRRVNRTGSTVLLTIFSLPTRTVLPPMSEWGTRAQSPRQNCYLGNIWKKKIEIPTQVLSCCPWCQHLPLEFLLKSQLLHF